MLCDYCGRFMQMDEPRMGYTIYACDDCDYVREYDYGTLVYESKPDRPGEPPVRITH